MNAGKKCFFCGCAVSDDSKVEIGLTGNHKVGLTSQSWTAARMSIPCCNTCADSLRRECYKTWLRWLMITGVVYVVCATAIALFIRAETMGLAISAGCAMSFLPALLTLSIIARLTPMPFAPAWHKKVAVIPKVATLLANGFKICVRIKDQTVKPNN